MKQDTKKNVLSALLYIVLAAMIVSAVCISVVSVAKKARQNIESSEKSSEKVSDNESSEPSSAPSESQTESDSETESISSTETESESGAKESDPPANSAADAEVKEILPDEFKVPALGYISKSYDADMPVFSLTMEDYRIHDGIDIACDVDSEVYSCADGVVESIYEDPLMGYGMTVYHGAGLRSVYLNLSDRRPDNLYEGAEVAAGQVIGYVGEGALIECAEVPHLHFTMSLDDDTVDALSYIVFDEGTVGAGAFEE